MSYINTLITIAPDCLIQQAEIPESTRKVTPVHLIHFNLLKQKPYYYNHEELIFETYLIRENLTQCANDEKTALWDQLFSKGHPCLRASALTKKFGYGAHYNKEGKIALYEVESSDYQRLSADPAIEKIPAMRTKRK